MAAAAAPPLHSVFVYGTLLADKVVRVLLKRVPPSSPAILHNYHRFSIKGRVYPAILPVDCKKVAGEVLLGITDQELDILDSFEDVEYERRAVEVSLVDNSEKLMLVHISGLTRMIQTCMGSGILRNGSDCTWRIILS
ncbi:unnamed protein product [Musa textilis]